MRVPAIVKNALEHAPALREAGSTRNPRVMASLLGPALRGLVLRQGKQGPKTAMPSGGSTAFDWTYARDDEELRRLTRAARRDQWDQDRDLDWSTNVDPQDPRVVLMDDRELALGEIPQYRALPAERQREQCRALLAWMLSQFLHGEQGALYAACQLTEQVDWVDAKLYGATQVLDEARHVEVFLRYIDEKLEKRYQVNDSLFVVLDAVVRDSRWDVKFLGMQLLIEGLALGAFGTIRSATQEPLLRELLRRVMTDEARHVHFGVVALERHLRTLPARELRDRQDWAFEMCLMARNRFLAHEFYEEHYGSAMSLRAWDALILGSRIMERYRRTVFRRIVPNLKRVGLLPERLRPHYAAIGLLVHEHEKAAPELSVQEVVEAA